MKGHIIRKKKGKKYIYHFANGKPVKDKKILEFISHLRIPPAYKDVKIFPNATKLVATGIDAAGRKQYIYSKKFIKKQEKMKHCNLIKFSKILPKIVKKMEKDIKKNNMSKEFIIALVLKILMFCNFRIGNQKYRNLYKSYGISSIKTNHVKYVKNNYNISFIGKKGVLNACDINDVNIIKCIHLIKQSHQRSKKNNGFFFQYAVSEQKYQPINANDINDYLKQFDKDITSKFFRTWKANILFLTALKDIINESNIETERSRKTIIKKAIEETAHQLHHTAAICKKSYLNHDILDMFIKTPGKMLFEMKKERNVNHLFINLLKIFCKN